MPMAAFLAFLALHLLLSVSETTIEARTAEGHGTARGGEEDELRFLVIGDWGAPRERPECKATQRLVARAMELLVRRATDPDEPGHADGLGGAPSFVLSLGDAFYMNGIVNGEDPRLDEVFAETFAHAPSLARVPWRSVLGNHDCRGNVSALVHAGSRARTEVAGRSSAAFVLPARYWGWRWGVAAERDVGAAPGASGGAEGRDGGAAADRAEGRGVRLSLVDTCSLVCAPGNEAEEAAAVWPDVRAVLREAPHTPARWRALQAGIARWERPQPTGADGALPPSPLPLALGFNFTLNRQMECARVSAEAAASPARKAQLAWLSAELRGARAAGEWAIVAGHSPIRSVGAGHGDYPQLLARLRPRLASGAAHVYLSGDEHSLQHIEEDGLHMFVLGAGGGLNLHPLQPAQPDAPPQPTRQGGASAPSWLRRWFGGAASAPSRAAGGARRGGGRVLWARSELGFAAVRASRSQLSLTVYAVLPTNGSRATLAAGSGEGADLPQLVGSVLDDDGVPHRVAAAHTLVLRRGADGRVEHSERRDSEQVTPRPTGHSQGR